MYHSLPIQLLRDISIASKCWVLRNEAAMNNLCADICGMYKIFFVLSPLLVFPSIFKSQLLYPTQMCFSFSLDYSSLQVSDLVSPAQRC